MSGRVECAHGIRHAHQAELLPCRAGGAAPRHAHHAGLLPCQTGFGQSSPGLHFPPLLPHQEVALRALDRGDLAWEPRLAPAFLTKRVFSKHLTVVTLPGKRALPPPSSLGGCSQST